MKPFRIWQFVPYSLEGNLGQAYNEYIGLVPKDDDWIFLCDGDVMILTPRYLHLIQEIIERNPDVGMFTTYTNRVQSKVQIVSDMFEERDIIRHRMTALHLYDEHKYDLKEINQMISGYCMIFKKSVWKEIGGFTTEGMLGVDNDFSSRVLKSGRKIMLMKGVYALHYYRMAEGIADTTHLVKAISEMKPDMLVSSRGIAASCEVRPAEIISNTRYLDPADYLNIKNGDSVYVITNALLNFITHVLPRLEKDNINITLVTGAADTSSPREISAIDRLDYNTIFSRSPAVSQWFTQNYDLPSEDSFVHPIPLGLDYHRLAESETQWGPKASPEEQNAQMLEVATASKPFEERLNRSFSFYGFKMYRHRHQRDRFLANEALKNADYNDVLPHPLNRLDTWKKMSEYKFIISPHGTGLDCFRTYEALALGCMPVVKSSTLDFLYKDFPVIILPSWNDISISFLLSEAERLKHIGRNGLSLKYWADKIKGK